MSTKKAVVYGIGNPLIDLNYKVSDQDLANLGLNKGIMHLIDDAERAKILSYLKEAPISYLAGGDCPNVMVNLALLGTPSAFGGKVGDDDFGNMYEQRLGECGAVSDLSFGKGSTGSSIILVSPDGERTMNTYLGMCQHFESGDVSRPLLDHAEALFFTGYLWDTPSQKDAVTLALSMAQNLDRLVAFDAADPFAVGRYREDFLRLLETHADIAFANTDEAKALFGKSTAEECARRMAELVPCGSVKAGADGAWVFMHGEIAKVPAFKVAQVADTTGAGDSFAAGFLHGLFSAARQSDGSYKALKELTIADAVRAGRTAAFVAATIISRTGPQLTLEEAPLMRESLASGAGKAFVEA